MKWIDGFRAFMYGVWEFRRSMTRRFDNEEANDWGREMAHRITARYFDDV